MSVREFVPEKWSSSVLRGLEKELVFGQPGIINRDYEGEITDSGDRVKINSISSVTLGTYTGADIPAASDLSAAQTELIIDQQRYFNIRVKDVDKVQANAELLSAGMAEATYAVRDDIDQYLSSLYTDMNLVVGTEASPQSVATVTDAYDEVILPLKVALGENSTPREGRFIIVPEWFEAVLLQDDRFVSFGGTDQVLNRANGAIGRIAGFTVYVSNNVTETSSHAGAKIISGVPQAWSLAVQIPVRSMEAYRPEANFADAVKGLTLYGAKVVRSSNMAYAIVSE